MQRLLVIFLFSIFILFNHKSFANSTENLKKQVDEINHQVLADHSKIYLYDSLVFQNLQNTDSLNVVYILNQKAAYYLKTNQAAKAIETLEPIIKSLDNLKSKELNGKIHFNLGFAYVENLQYFESFPHFEKAYESSQLTQDSLLNARSLHFLGIADYLQGNNTQAVVKMYQAHLMLKKLDDHEFLLHSCNDLGVFFMGLKNNRQAKHYLQLALKYDTLNHPAIKSYQSIIYTNFGVLYLSGYEKYDSSIYYNQLALNTMDSSYSWTDQFSAKNNLHVIEIKTGQYDAAYQYFSKAYDSPEIKTIPYYYSNIVMNYSTILVKTNPNELAYQISLEAARLARENHRTEFLYKALQNVYIMDSLRGDFSKALKHYQEMIDAKNKIQANEVELELTRLHIDAELEKINKEYQQLISENLARQQKIDRLSNVSKGQWILIFIFTIVSGFLIKTLISNKKLLQQLSQLNEQESKTNRLLEAQTQKIELENQNKDRIFSLLSHDFRSPLSNLTGILSLIIDSWNEIDDLEKWRYIKKLNIQTQNTLINVEETLDWAQLNRNKIEAQMVPIHLKDVFQKLELDHQTLAENKKIRLAFENTIDCSINSDPEILDHILHNLITNAIKFTPKSGKISIASFKGENLIHIQVKDSGIGIPHNKIDHLFKDQHHFNRKGTAGENSTGLGLIIVKKFCELINAKIHVESKVGMGSTFTIMIPI